MMREKETEAMFSLSILNSGGTADQVINLFKDLEKYTDVEKLDKINFYESLRRKSHLKMFLFVIAVNAITYIDFSEIFVRVQDQNEFQFFSHSNLFLVMVISLIGLPFSVVLVLLFSRRLLMLSGFILVAFLQLVTAILFFVEDMEYNITSLRSFSQIKTMLLYGIYVSIIYPIVNTLRGELFPYPMKIQGNALIEMFQLSTPLALYSILPSVTTYFDAGFTYALRATISWLTVAYVYVHYKETKNLSLLQIRDLYGI
jgi:MFS family permease